MTVVNRVPSFTAVSDTYFGVGFIHRPEPSSGAILSAPYISSMMESDPAASSTPPVLDAPSPAYLWSQLFVEELLRLGVETFFIAPGSRSTPLTVAIARHSQAKAVLHVDERGAAFAALGVGRTTQTPAAWITTSGTAVANGLPAAVEAANDGVPLLLITSDRPPELRDTGANQTIDQVKIFGDYVRWQVDMPPPSGDIDPAYILTTADHAVHRATRAPAGPVHLNCMFRKPLDPVETGQSVSVPTAVQDWAERSTPFTEYPSPTSTPPAPKIAPLIDVIDDTERGLVVAGRLDTDAEAKAVLRLAKHLDWPLLPDVTSRLRLGSPGEAPRVPYGDLVLVSEKFREDYGPEVVLHIGGRLASKRLRLFLRNSQPKVRAVMRPDPSRLDPDHRVTHHLETDISAAAEAIASRVKSRTGQSTWSDAWTAANQEAEVIVRAHAEKENDLTEPAVATVVSDLVPPEHALVVASSMPVRDVNRHGATSGSDVPVYANRGASGIDGTVSTAAGVALGRNRPVTLLIGDLALWHDLNGLALLTECPVVGVVVNNNGGGIFHFLPIHEHEEVFDPYFTTPHGRSFEEAAATFDVPYSRAQTLDDFRETYKKFCRSGTSALIEVQTDREQNRNVHETLEQKVAQVMEENLLH